MVRENDENQLELLKNNYIDKLIKMTTNESNQKLRLKSIFLFSSLCQNEKISEELTKKNFASFLVNKSFESESEDFQDYILSCLYRLISVSPKSLEQVKGEASNLQQKLQKRIEFIKNDEKYSDELEIIKNIKEKISK
jgi:hypothetical protein